MLMLSVNYLQMIYKYRLQIKCVYAEDRIAHLRFLEILLLCYQVLSHHHPWASDGGLHWSL